MTEKIILGPSGPPITTSAAGTDYINVWKGSALQQITKANFIGATLTGAGTVATGGFTLTVPATGTAALLGVTNTFTRVVGIAPTSTTELGLNIAMPASTSTNAVKIEYNGSQRVYIATTAGASQVGLQAADYGATIGPSVVIERNTNGTGAAGNIRMMRKDGTEIYWWNDASSNARSGTTPPTSANDTSGTVIGTQTSMAEAKNISDVLPEPAEALRSVIEAAKTGLRAWSYKSGSYNNEYFPNGLVTDLAPRYGMDRDEAHPAGKSLNIPVAIGDLFAAVALIANHLGINLEDK